MASVVWGGSALWWRQFGDAAGFRGLGVRLGQRVFEGV